jgi:hypothetical protein
MKKGISLIGILAVVLFLATSFSLRENPQDPPRGAKKHIKLIKEKNGQKMELDTILEGDQILVWDGDTIGKHLKIDKEDVFSVRLDSLQKTSTLEYAVSGKDGKGVHKIVMLKSNYGEPEVFEFKGDSKSNAVWMSVDSDNKMPHTAGVSKIVSAPHIKAIKTAPGRNVIDLSDPGIISYEKKKLSGGREKIEIIRHEVDETNQCPEICIKNSACDPINCLGVPATTKKVRIFKKDNGDFQIVESDSCTIKTSDGNKGIVIMKDGKGDKKIQIRETKESDGKKVKVMVIEDVEKK